MSTFDPESWVGLTTEEDLGPEVIATTRFAEAVYRNLIALAQGDANAPRVRPPAIGGGWFQMGEVITSGLASEVDLYPAELDDPAYEAARLELRARVSTNTVGLRMRASVDAGASFSSASNHYLQGQGAPLGGDTMSLAGQWVLCDDIVDSTAANRWVHAVIELHELANHAMRPHWMTARSVRRMTVQSGNFRHDLWTGILSSLHAGAGSRVNAWRVFANSGTIAELEARFWGLRRAS